MHGVCTIVSSVYDHVSPNSHCHTSDNSFSSELALKSTRHQMASHRLLRPKRPVLQGIFFLVCYALVTAQGVGRSSWRTPGSSTLSDSACNKSSSSHPGSAGGCRDGGPKQWSGSGLHLQPQRQLGGARSATRVPESQQRRAGMGEGRGKAERE